MTLAGDAPMDVELRQRQALARHEAHRREVELLDPSRVEQVDRAVREFPVLAYAASVLPAPLPVEVVEKLPRGERRTLGSGHSVRHELVETPSEVRGWMIDPGLVVSIHGVALVPVHEPVGKPLEAALPPRRLRVEGYRAVTSLIAGWEPHPPPLMLDVPTRSGPVPTPTDRLLVEFVERHRR